jgi:limonene-1,2-epoxide hydrolase
LRYWQASVDDFHFDGTHGVVPVVGILSMADGRITEWLEYYDRPTLLKGMGLVSDFD